MGGGVHEVTEYQGAFLWPRYIEKKWQERKLSIFDCTTNTFYEEDGQVTAVSTPLMFIISCFERNMLTFIDDFRHFPYLDECLARGAYVPCTELGKPIAIRLKGPRGTTRWIVNVGAWGCEKLSVGWLRDMREMYSYMGVGTQSTPGALGQAEMRRVWKEEYGDGWKKHRHQRPPGIACKQIQEASTGARSDTIAMQQSFETAWEIDAKNAYGHAARKVPTGYTYRVLPGGPEQVEGYETYFVRCHVLIHDSLKYGPFPIRRTSEFGQQIPDYPTEPGAYVTWLWREEVELARARGCVVFTHEGWAWEEWTEELTPFVDLMTRLRDEAPTEFIASQVKGALVAALGRFGMPAGLHVLVPEDQATPDDLPLAINGEALNWFVQWKPDPQPVTMPHWFSFILMKCRLSLFEQAEKYAISEHLIATNTDAVIVTPDADVSAYPDRGQQIETGQWRKRLLHEVVVPAPRHLESKEKWVTPGVPEKKRRRRYKARE
jgi:hypothetical protein